MNLKTNLKFPVFCILIICAANQLSQAMVREYRKTQDEIMQQAQRQIDTMPEKSRDIQRKALIDTRDTIEAPGGQPASPLRPLKERIDQLLAKQQINPEEIDAVRLNLEKVAQTQAAGIDRAEYESLKEKLDLAYGFSNTISSLQSSYAATVDKLNNNFEAVADDGDKVAFWKNIFSGGFAISFLANLIAFFGLVIKVPDVKLERKLKQLLIIEKRAKLEQDGISLQQYA
jgi:hypothetical protein